MEKEPKFNPGYEFLENEDILALDMLLKDTHSSFKSPSERKLAMAELIEKWNRFQELCIREVDSDHEQMKSFLRFVEYAARYIDSAGISVGRSGISNFVDEKVKELYPYIKKFSAELL